MAPLKTLRKKKPLPYCEEDLKQALHDIRENKMGVRQTCRKYGVPRSTIQDRIYGKRGDAMKTRGPDPVLGVESEKRIKEWLITIAKRGFPINKQMLLDTIQKIVKDNGPKNFFKDDRPGQTWYMNFLKRHPELPCLIYEGTRKDMAVSEESLRTWFQGLKNLLQENNKDDILKSSKRIFLGDETGFSLCLESGEILTPKSQSNFLKSRNEKDNLTAFVAFNANAQISPPLIVFPHIATDILSSVPTEWCVGKSEGGWMKTDVFFEYITNDFNDWVDEHRIRKPILLLVDSGLQLSLDFSDSCEKLGIILYALPQTTVHIVNEEEVSILGPLKTTWKETIRDFLSKPENIESRINKRNFCHLLRDTLENTNITNNVENRFRKYGFDYPYNPDASDSCSDLKIEIEYLEVASSESEEITGEDIVRTEKVLKYLEPKLARKAIDVDVIFKELRKLEKQVGATEASGF